MAVGSVEKRWSSDQVRQQSVVCLCKAAHAKFPSAPRRHSPFNSSDEENQVAVDFGAVDEFVNVASVHRLSCLQAARPDAVAHWRNKC